MFGGRLFVHTTGNPYALVTPVTHIIRDMSADQPVEHAATLEDIRAEVLAPDRLNTLVFGGFAAWRWRLRWSASRACWRFRSVRARANSASAWRSARSRKIS